VFEGGMTIALKACQWPVAYIICQADNRFLIMRMRSNVEMKDPRLDANAGCFCLLLTIHNHIFQQEWP